ncbi:hypothetical protein ACU8L2_26665 (plasmid) [Rhizobium leguminosarum]
MSPSSSAPINTLVHQRGAAKGLRYCWPDRLWSPAASLGQVVAKVGI